jgi:uncharacterized protein (TIGR03435 family)
MIPIANHLWQSTVFAGIAALLALALRHNHARTRYWLWLIASMKFLIPFSLLVGLGSHVDWQPPQPVAQPELTVMVEQISQPFPHIATQQHSLLPYALSALWACGFVVVAFSWGRRWRRIRAAVRSAAPLARIENVPVLSTQALLEPGVFGILRPVLLLPEGITGHLTPAHLEAIVAHELCHIRRRDNLAATLHMMVEAIFWFHPLVWWLGSRLVEERERACDEEVLLRGNRPEVYAESILKTCEFYLAAPLAGMSGISGSDLKKRIVRIMSQHMSTRLSLSRKILLAAAGLAAVAGPLALGLLHAQAQPSFEVASIKPNKSADRGVRIENQPGRFRAVNVSLKFLIEFAYDLKDTQLAGATGWISSENYDVDAKVEAAAGQEHTIGSDEELEQRRQMLQSLLADRFKLALRRESKELPVYALVVAKSGAKLHESAALKDEPGKPGARMARMDRGVLTMNSVPIAMLCDALSRISGRNVIDNTGLKGNYDIALKWTPDESQGQMLKGLGDGDKRDAPPPSDATGPSIFTALEEQLGLKLESQKAPVDTFAIEHVERPSAN